jgi:hypothetical protein
MSGKTDKANGRIEEAARALAGNEMPEVAYSTQEKERSPL